MYKNILV